MVGPKCYSKTNLNEAGIMRLINNRLYEGKHPFARDSVGMADFGELTGILRKRPKEEVAKYVAEIERIFEVIKDCQTCTAKLCAYLVFICEGILEDKYQEYAAKLEPLRKNERYNRDYKDEVYSLLKEHER